ncbi:MAG: ferritin [Kiritimatiellae bacterium]|nr:ferritin [Kiritimatiellia bacterium]
MNKKMTEAINGQINKELFSSYLYLAMAADAMDKGFKGVAHWLTIQAGEEKAHAERFTKYLYSQNAKVVLTAIEAPQTSWKDVQEMFAATLKHEQFITASINDLGKLAKSLDDFATLEMLQWFFKEQVEEEGNAQDILWMLEMAAGSKGALFQVDRKLGKRGDD